LSSEDLKSRITRLAVELGFAASRIAPAAPPPHAAEFLAWLAEGHAADMDWLHRNADRRTDLQKVLPGARSVVMLAANYWQGPRPDPPADAACGTIARYAWGGDYHDWMLERMQRLSDVMATEGGVQKIYVDTGPVIERDFAALSGLGWHGKSTMLINRRLGTWFFLGEILTTLDLTPDPPEKDHCGRCTRCIEACPTGAIIAPQKLDARKCLSYLTIENKGSIPLEYREALGDRIYGCDDCLDACPWNRFATASREAIFQAKNTVLNRPLRDFLSLDNQGFRALFRGSPILRIRRPRFLRNVCVALGNVGTTDDLPALTLAAADPHPLISEHAQWALTRIIRKAEILAGCRAHGLPYSQDLREKQASDFHKSDSLLA